MATQAQVVQILGQLKAQGEDMPALQKRITALSEDQQHAFFDHLAGQMEPAKANPADLGPSQGQEQRAASTPGANYVPDNADGSQQSVAQESFKPVKDFVKPAVEQLPAAGALVGGTLGAASGTAAGGIGAVPGGFAGAAAGGAVGASLENGLKSILWPEEASRGIVGGLAKAGMGAIEGIANEAGGKAFAMAGEGVGITTKAIGDQLGTIGKVLTKPAAGAITGAAAGGMLAGQKGAYIGAAAGALGASGQIEKLASWYKNPLAAAGVPALDAKAAEAMMTEKRATGKLLGETSKAVDTALTEAKLPEGPYMTKAEMRNDIEHQIIQDGKEQGGLKPDTYYKSLRRELDNWLGIKSNPNEVMTARKTQVTASNLNRQANSFEGKTSAQSLKEVRTDIAAKMRQYNDNLVLKTGDEELISQWTDQKKKFSVLATQVPEAQKVLKVSRAASNRQAAMNYTAHLLAQGPDVLGKYYKRLQYATVGRGLAGATTMAAHMLYNDQDFRDLVDSINVPSGDSVDSGSQ